MNTKIGQITFSILLAALLALTGLLQAGPDVVLAQIESPAPLEIVSAGFAHICALTPNGAVDCWGRNDEGQAVDQAGPYTQVSAGEYHTCALTPTGEVDCWGDNTNGQVSGIADSAIQFGTQPGPYTQVSAGDRHTCALKSDGSIDCWGSNGRGQSSDQAGPYTQVSAGAYHTCALTPSGAVDCWGYNSDGQVSGTVDTTIQFGTQPGPYTQVSAGDIHTCALTSTEAVDCWGNNIWGAAGDQSGPYTQVSAGALQTCALMPSGAVDCWGDNIWGTAGDQSGPYTQVSAGVTATCALTPSGGVDCWGSSGQVVDWTGSHTQVSAGAVHTCALTPSGAVDCWGDNYYGQSSDQAGPFTQVSAGVNHTCALTPSGAVDCWGGNYYGQSSDQAGPYTQVSAGEDHTCALTPSGAVDCWGADFFGQVADQSGPYTQVSVGTLHNCALTPSGAVDCWGYNEYGQAADQAGPYTQVSAGQHHTCALTPSGAVDCWGDNYYGESSDQAGPYTQVSAGDRRHTCALTPSGAVDCWGYNEYGQAADQAGPYTQVSAGDRYTCALTPSGAVDCWGYNNYGQAADQPAYGPYDAPPETTFESTPADPSHANVTFSFSSNDPDATFACQFDTSAWTACTSPQAYLFKDAGGHTFQVQAIDATGYTDATPASFTWTVANIDPAPLGIVSSGWYHTCALKPEGSIDCWGVLGQDHGQAADQAGPYTQVSSGDNHTCALTPTGEVDCWGAPTGYDYGQAEDKTGPYTQVDVGVYHTCALKSDGSIDCWGYNNYGQVSGAADEAIHFGTHPGPYSQVSAGALHTCALMQDGAVDCWGATTGYDYGQAVDQTGPYSQVDSGTRHTCALKLDGSIDCWGDNTYGQAADQTGPYNWINAGGYHTCGLTSSGAVDCWGDNNLGRAAGQFGPYAQVSAGAYHTCALTPDGAVDCWGDNTFGQAADQIGPFGPLVLSQPAITTQPASQTAFVGDAVSFNAAASGDPLPTLQWQVSTDSGATWADIDGATSSSLSFTASLDQNGNQYRAVFTNDLGSAMSNVATLTVSKRTATVTLSNLQQTYDGSAKPVTVTTDPAGLSISITYDGSATAPMDAGEYAVIATVNSSTYQGSASGTLVIGKRAISVQADAQEKVFGESDPELTYQITSGSLVGSDSFSGALSRAAGEMVGTYAIQQDTLALSGNYDLSFTGNSLTINKKPASVTPAAASKTYGDVDPALTGELGGFVEADGVTAAYSRTEGEIAGSTYTISALLSPEDVLSNYDITYNTAAFTIDLRLIEVTADSMTKFVGQADPQMTYQITSGSLAFSDAFSGELTRSSGETAGTYTILQGTLVLNSNYNITYNAGTLTIVEVPAPILTGISPASTLAAGSSDVILAVTGSDFIVGSTVRWNGAYLATTYLSDTQLTAIVPAGNLAAVQTAQVTVFTPAPGGGASDVLAFFVTQASANVTEQKVASGTDPIAASGASTAAATGEGLLAVAQYDANPGGTPSFTAGGVYFDVYTAPDNNFLQVNIVACSMTAGDKLYWWNVGEAKWQKASPQTYDSGCITLVVTDSSSPSLSQLQGTYFASGTEPNTAPTANPGGPYLGAINTAISFDGSLSSDPENDPLSYAWDFGDGSTGNGATLTHTYTAPAIYDLCLTVNDGTLDSDPICTIVVVYDPNGGFVTGGGWILSPAGAYLPDESLSGKATFGFASKYKKGASVPEGNTEFQFQAAGFNFHSESYEWLVVNQGGANAQFKGSGTVNGALDQNGNAYKFMLWAGDGSPDTFRIKIWWEDASGVENVVYDNGFNQVIGGGSIVVHTSK